jgi:hypothetical protein
MMNDECRMQNEGTLAARLFFPFLFCILHSAFTISPAFAQVKGEVESIGFENYYRNDCWTQMVIRLTPETDKAADYLVCVHQQDMDRDRPIFTRQVTVTGTDENGNARDQRFRVYFKPTPTDDGLPDASDVAETLASLQKKLTVDLTTTGGKFIATLPITNTILSLDNPDHHRGSKFVLAVTTGASVPPHREYEPAVTIGMLEDVAMVPVAANELPENAIGYDAVDAILWLDASPDELTAGGDERLRALQNYVRGGGHLVICQQAEQWQKTLGFGDLLPVSISGVRVKGDAEPLRSLASGHERTSGGTFVDPWDFMHGPMTLGIATAKPGAFVDEWINWPNEKNGEHAGEHSVEHSGERAGDHDGQEHTPYLARKSYGCGCVTWVAQDLGDRSLASTMVQGERMETIHWPAIWNRVFDWKDDPLIANRVSDQQKLIYSQDNTQRVDLGSDLNDKTMELNNKSLWYISVAVIFFIAYWLVAGPGTFFFLLSKGRGGANWFVFAGTALVFTFLTILLVDVIVRGAPDLAHFSLVRDTAAQTDVAPAAHVYSRFGLYIPKDGEQVLEIKDSAPGTAADLSAYSIPPVDLKDPPNDIGPEYVVPISDVTSGESTVVRFPYRRTLKKLEASWTGDPAVTGLSGGIEGTAKLVDKGQVEGKLTNGTGRNLRDVYFAYKWHTNDPEIALRSIDYLVYIPEWATGVTLDLASDLRFEADKDGKAHPIQQIAADGANPDTGHKCRGTIQNQWEPYWLRSVAGNMASDATMALGRSLIVLSLFDRLAPTQKLEENSDRLELVRRGARRLDCSAALAAGSMVIVAGEDITGPSTLALPLEVNGDRVGGSGTRLYQFIVPMDNTFVTTPTTEP